MKEEFAACTLFHVLIHILYLNLCIIQSVSKECTHFHFQVSYSGLYGGKEIEWFLKMGSVKPGKNSIFLKNSKTVIAAIVQVENLEFF